MIERRFNTHPHHLYAARRRIRYLGRCLGSSSPDAPPTLRRRRGVFSFPPHPTRPGGTDDRHDDEGEDPARGRGARTAVGDRRPLARHRASLFGRRRRSAPRLGPRGAHGRKAGRRASLETARDARLHRGARRDDRRPGGRDVEGRPRRDLPVGLAGRGRREPRRTDVPGPVALPGELRPGSGPPAEQRADARGPDRVVRGPRHPSASADRRGRRSRVRRSASTRSS